MNIDFTYIAIVLVIILFSMTFHEAMHAFASYWLGDDTAKLMGRLTFNPIKHIDPYLSIMLPLLLALSGGPIFGGAKPVPFNPNNVRWGDWGVAIVAAAGPLTNFLIAFVAFGLWILFGTTNTGLFDQIMSLVVSINLGFCVFNLIPIPPLDGSRILYALAPDFARRGMEMTERFGILIIFSLLILAGPSFNLFISTAIGTIINVFSYIFGL